MMNKNLFIALLALPILSCAPVENEDTEEQSCATAAGTWYVNGMSCNGVAQTVGDIRVIFNSSSNVHLSIGDDSCRKNFPFSASMSLLRPEIDMTGNGNHICQASGSEVNSCSGAASNCDNTDDNTGKFNNYDSCIISGNQMTISRTASQQNVDDEFSGCAGGESEVLILSQTQSVSPTPSAVIISESDPYDFGSINTGSSDTHSFTLTNNTSDTITSISPDSISAPYSFLGGAYPGTGGDCAATLSGNGASCTFIIEFSPSSTGTFNEDVTINYSNGTAQRVVRQIIGTGTSAGVPAVLTISESDPYDYGSLAVGSSSNHLFTVSNTGGQAATLMSGSGLAAPFQFSSGTYPGVSGSCGATLAAGANCTIEIQFSPLVNGVSNDTISISYNDGVAAQSATRDVTGTGLTPALLVISESDPYNYGSVSVGFTSNHIFTVTNTGGINATSIFESGLAAPFVFTGGAYPGVSGTCGAVVAPGSNCTIEVQFAPAVAGVQNDSIHLNYNDGVTSQSTTRDVMGAGF